jgi:hypothetical protein
MGHTPATHLRAERRHWAVVRGGVGCGAGRSASDARWYSKARRLSGVAAVRVRALRGGLDLGLSGLVLGLSFEAMEVASVALFRCLAADLVRGVVPCLGSAHAWLGGHSGSSLPPGVCCSGGGRQRLPFYNGGK